MFQHLPPLTPEEYSALEASILEHGILSPVITDENGVILDGHHRSRIAAEHSLSCPKQIVYGKTDTEKRTMALSMNLDRRHLNREQKRALVAESVKADPQMADNVHAKRTGSSDKTVTSIREELEATSEIPKFDKTIGADGKERPARRSAPANVDTETGEIQHPRTVTGMDGKTYTRPAPEPVTVDHDTGEITQPEPRKRPRRPIHETARSAAMNLREAADRLGIEVHDDRFPAIAEELAPQLRNQLAYVIETCQGYLDELTPNKE